VTSLAVIRTAQRLGSRARFLAIAIVSVWRLVECSSTPYGGPAAAPHFAVSVRL